MSSKKPGAIIIEGHIQGLSNTRSLGETGIPVYVVDKTNCIARYSKYCKKFFKCPDFIEDDFVDFLIDLAREENIRDWILIPSNDHAVYSISRKKKQLEEYYKIITPDFEKIEKIYDKSKLIQLAENLGIPVPKTEYFTSPDGNIPENLSFPLLTKGKKGLSFYKRMHRKAFLARNEDELRNQLKMISSEMELENTFTQELIPYNNKNKTISFTAFCEKGEIKAHWSGMKLREHPFQFGTATLAKSINGMECYILSVPLLKELEYTGVCEVEYLLDPRDNKYKLIEINARTWLWVGLAKATGVDFVKIMYNYVFGLENKYPQKYEIGKLWINNLTDLFFSMKALFSFKLGLKEYISSLSKRKTKAVFSWKDSLPGIIFPFMLFSIFKKRR